MTTNEDISIPFEGAKRKTFAVKNIVEYIFDDFIFQSALGPIVHLPE